LIALLVAVIAAALIALLVTVIAAALIALLVAVITAALISLLVAVITTAVILDRVVIAVIIAPGRLGARFRLRLRIPVAAGLTVTTGRDIQNLPAIDVVGVRQTIGSGNFIGVHTESSANGIQGVPMLDGVIKPATPTAAITRLGLTLRD
jgi:ABC-type uncharacterized transport system permease subunit